MNNEKNGHEFLLDTNACIKYLKGNRLSILQQLSALPRQQVVLCDIVKLDNSLITSICVIVISFQGSIGD
jgi:hypothetical protein